jgi:hypothetical protein
MGYKVQFCRYISVKNFISAEGLCIEAMSSANFLIGMIKDEGLKRESINEMLKKQVEIPEDDFFQKYLDINEYGLGFERKPSLYGLNYAHGGNNRGFSSFFLFNKEKKFGFVYFTNSNSCHYPGCPELYQKLEPFLISGE